MSEHMDELAKAMASGTSRRRALRALWTGALGLGAAALFPRRAQAASQQALDHDVIACIRQNCTGPGLSPIERALCRLQCLLGDSGNSHSF